MENVIKNFSYMIFEVAQDRDPILKELDSLFTSLKLGSKDTRLQKKIVDNIKKFTKINGVTITIKPKLYNAAIFVNYSNSLPTLIKDNGMPFDTMHKYIDSIHITLGEDLIKKLPSRQITAILLHEFGHLYQYTSNLTRIVQVLTKHLSSRAAIVSGIRSIFNPVFFPLFIATYTLSRSLTFMDHMHELDADKFAVKYGYGDELVKAFYTFHKGSKTVDNKTWLRNTFEKIYEIIKISSHPSNSKRICGMIKEMKTKYKDTYPDFSKEITIKYSDIKC